MRKIKMLITAALCGLAVTALAGCGETTLKPENINGVYSNGERTYVAKYDTDVELNTKEKATSIISMLILGKSTMTT